LRKAADWQRFAGSEVAVTLRAPLQGRKHWRGQLQPREAGWRLVLPRDAGNPTEALDFDLHEVREARLVPQLDFKGRRARQAAS
jgi:ribosome maturation factor RimP